MSPGWEPLGEVSPLALAESRLVLHHAAQLVAAVGRSLVTPRADDGHTSLEWLSGTRSLAGEIVAGSRRWRAALRPDALVLAVLADATPPRELPLAGRTFGEAATWLVREGEARGAPSGALRFETPYALPSPALAGGGAFLASRDDARAELARWFANADGLLRAVAGAWPGAVPVRVWPHHFDVGSVLPLAGHDGKHDATVGVGLSPGDEGIPEPYWYVTLWPLPGEPRPELAVGRWHTTAWTGAVLTGSELVAAGNAGAQAGLATRFVSEAIEGMRAWQRGRGR